MSTHTESLAIWSSINSALNEEQRQHINKLLWDLHTIKHELKGWTEGQTCPVTGKPTPERRIAETLDELLSYAPNHLEG